MRGSAILLVVGCLALAARVSADGGAFGGLDAGSPMDAGLDDASSACDACVDAAFEDAAALELEPEEAAAPTFPAQSAPAAALPPAAPDPVIAPIVGETESTPQAQPIAAEDRPRVVVGTLLGLLGLLALAYLGGHPRVQALERRLGVSQVITAGFPFVLLGLFSRHPAVNLLSDALLADVSPLLRVGLSAIGFVSGFRFGAQFRAAPGTEVMRVAAFGTAVPFLLVALVSGGALLVLSGSLSAGVVRDPVFLRDAIILGTAGAMTARTGTELLRSDDAERLLARVLRLEELAGIVGLAVVAAYFRPVAAATWQLPGTAWLLLTIGLGAALGLLCFLWLRRPHEGPEFVVLTLGSIGLGAGLAGYLRLSPVVVSFIAGVCLTALPGHQRDRIRSALRRLERPIYLLSLIVIGALWQVGDPRGWALIPVFTLARMLGKHWGTGLAARYSGARLSLEEREVLAVSPMGPLAIAIVVNAQLLYPGGSISPIVAAVIGGGILTEVVVQWVRRRNAGGPSAPRRTRSVALSDPPESGP